jgi:hypothetical protein
MRSSAPATFTSRSRPELRDWPLAAERHMLLSLTAAPVLFLVLCASRAARSVSPAFDFVALIGDQVNVVGFARLDSYF